MKRIKHKGRCVIGGLCIVLLMLLWIYSSSFPIVREAHRVMTWGGLTGTALDCYADEFEVFREREGTYVKAVIVPLAVVPNGWDTSTVWVWYERRIYDSDDTSDGNWIAFSNDVARWTMKREHNQWKVIEVHEIDPSTEEGQRYFWVSLL